MKSLFDEATANEVKGRLGKLGPDSQRQWGKMTAAQTLAHCAISMQWAIGDAVPDSGPLPARLVGRVIKPLVLRNDSPLRRNSPTSKSLIVLDEKDLGTERARLYGLVERFAAGGGDVCTKCPHPFFGPLKPEEWAILMYKHLDHHLRQFGV